MICPYCKTLQPEPLPRLCVGCNMAIPGVRPESWRRLEQEGPSVRCQECGVAATTRQCRACGSKVRWPDGMVPLDEQPATGDPAGQGPAPDLELPITEGNGEEPGQ